MVCFRYIIVNTLHRGDNNDNNNNKSSACHLIFPSQYNKVGFWAHHTVCECEWVRVCDWVSKWVRVNVCVCMCVYVTLLFVYLHFLLWRYCPTRAMASSFTRFLDHTQRHTTVGRTPLDEWSAPRTDLYLTKHSTHNRHTYIPPVGFEATASGRRPTPSAARPTGTDLYKSVQDPKMRNSLLPPPSG